MKIETPEIVKTDLLIVGSEGAGSTAAIEAAKQGLSVLMVTKGNGIGRSGATITGEADIAVDSKSVYDRFKIEGSDPGDSKEKFFEDILKGGKFLNQQDLVEVQVEDAPERLKDLLDWGLKPLFTAKMSGHTYPRSVMVIPADMIRIYRRKAKEAGYKVRSNIMIQELLHNGGVCCGAYGIDLVSGAPVAFQAKATLLATGGGMRIYPITTAPEELTGDGTAMALRAGIELLDMEFPMFLPGCFPWPSAVKGVNTPFKFCSAGMVYGHMFNKHGERFMARWDPERMERSTRDILSVAIWTEIMENRGSPHGGVFVSLKHMPDNLVEYILDWLPPKYVKKFGGFDMSKFLPDLRREAVESVPACHFFNGGIRIDKECRSKMPGLYAAGEVTGGIHGSNRLGGNAFTDMLVWGHRAARTIALDISKGQDAPEILASQLENCVEESYKYFMREKGESSEEIRSEIMKCAWDYAGIVRNKELLEKGKARVSELYEAYKNAGLVCKEKIYNREWIRILETRNMLDNLACIIESAFFREESRGAHYRKDFPYTDSTNWLVNQILSMEADEIRIISEPPKITRIKPPEDVRKYGY